MRHYSRFLAAAALVAVVWMWGSGTSTAQGPERPRVYGLAYVTFRVTDISIARRFYEGWLGLQAATVSAGCTQMKVGARQHVFLQPGLPLGEDERLVSIGLVTESPERLAAYLRAKGVPVATESRCGRPVVRVADPEGHLLEFVAPPDASGPVAADGTGPRILHAGITVRDRAAMDRFYVDVLGFSEIWRGGRTDDVTDWINMKVADGTEYLEYMLVGAEPLTRQRLGSLHHVAVRVPDMQTAYEAVLARVPRDRWQEVGSPRVGRNRRWQLNLFDPDGTRTELMEPFPTR